MTLPLSWKPGLSALRSSHRRKVLDKNAKQSCDIDARYADAKPGSPRWDYVVERSGQRRTGACIEVHPASTGEVAALIAKKQWAESKLAADVPHLQITRWHWLATGGIHITVTSPQARRLATAGIERPRKIIHSL